MSNPKSAFFDEADVYEDRIDWRSRLEREIPLLCDLFGPPHGQAVLDAGCGPGRHAVALAQAGYTLTGTDADPEMLAVARRNPDPSARTVRWILAAYQELSSRAPGPFHGCYCIGNALAAAGTPARVKAALRAFNAVLVPGGRLLVHTLNFPLLRGEKPCIRGFRAWQKNERTSIHLKVFQFHRLTADVVSITLHHDGEWTRHAGLGRLCAMSPADLAGWTASAGLTVLHTFADYRRSPFDPDISQDFLLVAEKPE